ncbi:hypothetical protein EVAR_60271_1 [Eumeta japonica]|uniref:Reverse transcriptase domain-containing protein n=1 Tax=Eumeta variegata TaxID=151549 RepID=A0A4C1ZBE8_EUMVA|nr:hypothetical protein EVAR_60271_1 [Eumeta japonica]
MYILIVRLLRTRARSSRGIRQADLGNDRSQLNLILYSTPRLDPTALTRTLIIESRHRTSAVDTPSTPEWLSINVAYTGCFGIRMDVRQGCVASPQLFKDNCQFHLKEYDCEIRDELSVKYLLYADDKVILTTSACEFQEMNVRHPFERQTNTMSHHRLLTPVCPDQPECWRRLRFSIKNPRRSRLESKTEVANFPLLVCPAILS